MKKICLPLLLFSLLNILHISAQKNFTDGGIIRLNGDTLRGQIDYREWDINPVNIQFRHPPTGETYTYGTASIAGFFVTAKNEIYQTATVYLNGEPSATSEIPTYSSVGEALRNYKPERHTVFLRVLARGQMNFFEFEDKNRTHYLAQPTGDTIRALVARKVRVKGNVVPLDEYKNQLRLMTATCPNLGINFDRLPYFEGALLNVAEKFNRCAQNSIYETKKEKAGKFFYLMAGAGYPVFKMSGPLVSLNTRDKSYSLTGAVAPMLGVGCDFNFSRARSSRGAGLELYGTTYSLDYTTTDIFERELTYKADIGYLRALAFFRQNLSSGKVRPYLRAGFGGSVYFKPDVSYTYISSASGVVKSERPTKKGDVCILGALGVRMERFFVETRFEWGSNLADFDASETLKANLFSLVAGYRIFK